MYIKRLARKKFEESRTAHNVSEIEFLLQVGETQLDTVITQRKLLTDLELSGNLKGPR